MTQTYKKKLIEVAMPLEAINTASAREKSIRHGHPSTLHLYWARRPLAACRAVIFAQLVDDPSAHPDKFPTEADQQKERERLFKIIEELVIWENSTNEEVLKRARDEILKSCDGELPPVYDPFSGGGSIPLEAQRLGLPAYGSDLNPVAVAIGKAMIEIPSVFKDMKPIHPGVPEKLHYQNVEGLSEDVKYYGEWIREEAFKRIGSLYPEADLPNKYGGGKAKVIAWIWARTIPSPDPALNGIKVPLIKSFDLSTKKGQETWIEPKIIGNNYELIIRDAKSGFSKKTEAGTINRNGARCLISNSAMPLSYVRAQAKKGHMGQKLMAVVVESSRGRLFIEPTEEDENLALNLERPILNDIELSGKARVSVPLYGMETFSDLFTTRQMIGLKTICDLVGEVQEQIKSDALRHGLLSGEEAQSIDRDGHAYSKAICVYLGLGIGRLADISNSLCNWSTSANQAVHLFGRQAIPMVWDFAETSLFSRMAGDYTTSLNSIVKALQRIVPSAYGQITNADARDVSIPKGSIINTDPPYYDNIAYAELSDFFYQWLKPSIGSFYPDVFSVMATPKAAELIANPFRHDSKESAEQFFLEGMQKAIENMALVDEIAPAAIYYAFKQSEVEEEGTSSKGWATFLQAVINGGYSIVGTWPVRTERDTGLKVRKNVLATSVVLVCRKRQQSAKTLTRGEFVRELKSELPGAISKLKAANIAPADIPQSSIGPGIGIFSRYDAVLESDDTPMTVKTALQLINRELGAEEGDYDSETSFALTWFEQFGFNVSDYGTANNIANAKGIAVDALTHAGIAQSAGGKFSLLSRDSLEAGWDPDREKTVTIWECCQYLCRRLENKGEFEAAKLMRRMGPERADAAKELAYSLYDIAANKLNDATEATSYNSLISAWSELTVQAANMTDQDVSGDAQGRLL